ncbi:hypothetical protein DLM76_00995 [Leptospira yasudae]|nr:hypothetical protein DLM76_00995 [Leptospira yasudae]
MWELIHSPVGLRFSLPVLIRLENLKLQKKEGVPTFSEKRRATRPFLHLGAGVPTKFGQTVKLRFPYKRFSIFPLTVGGRRPDWLKTT